MDIKLAVSAINDFLLEAGEMALRKQDGIKRSYKEGQQALTEADLAVSALAQDRLSPFLAQSDHVLIDEESVSLAPSEVFQNSEYQWVLDPIDGTAGYALGRKMWGISLGLLHKGAPVAGGIYMPAADYYLLSDGDASYRIDISSGRRVQLQCAKMEINSQIFVESFYGIGHAWGDSEFSQKIWMNTPESAVQGGVSVLLGQSAGAILAKSYSIWDIVAILALARTAGFKTLSIADRSEWTRLSAKDFKDNWKLTSNWLVSHAENHDEISAALTGSYRND